MIRSVPWVAGCCGPMLRVMPSVSSSTLSRASAAWAAMYDELLALGEEIGHERAPHCRRSRRCPTERRRLLGAVLGAAASATSSAGGSPTRRRPGRASGSPARLAGDLVLGGASSAGIGSTSTMPGPRLDHPGQQREVLAQRVALELRRQVHVAQVGVPGEVDAEHLVGLPLVPVGAGVDGEPRLDRHRVVGDVDLER